MRAQNSKIMALIYQRSRNFIFTGILAAICGPDSLRPSIKLAEKMETYYSTNSIARCFSQSFSIGLDLIGVMDLFTAYMTDEQFSPRLADRQSI